MSAPGGDACEADRGAFVRSPPRLAGPPHAVEPAAEDRARAMRIAEYTPFPRVSRHQQKKLGFTSDEAGPILRVAARSREKPGTLLRVAVLGIDGRPQLETLARVAWCQENGGGYVSLGLALAEENQHSARTVRRSLEKRRGAITA